MFSFLGSLYLDVNKFSWWRLIWFHRFLASIWMLAHWLLALWSYKGEFKKYEFQIRVRAGNISWGDIVKICCSIIRQKKFPIVIDLHMLLMNFYSYFILFNTSKYEKPKFMPPGLILPVIVPLVFVVPLLIISAGACTYELWRSSRILTCIFWWWNILCTTGRNFRKWGQPHEYVRNSSFRVAQYSWSWNDDRTTINSPKNFKYDFDNSVYRKWSYSGQKKSSDKRLLL